MDKLADRIESALKRYGSKNIRTMLDSEDWRDIPPTPPSSASTDRKQAPALSLQCSPSMT